jgi:proteic killer suppression protein
MIRTFRHRGLKALYEGRSSARVTANHVPKVLRILTALDEATQPAEMDLPGFRLHALRGDLEGHYAVSVSGNWRVTFRFEDGHAVNVNYLDYHSE